ncbi:MAG: DUF4390 domain-containing protein [bacterium]
MSFLIGLLIAAKGLLFFSGSISGEKSPAVFNRPQILISNEYLKLNCRINNAFSKDLKKLAETGTPIILYLNIDFINASIEETVKTLLLERILIYDLVKKKYLITFTGRKESLIYNTLDSAISGLSNFSDISLLSTVNIQPGHYYFMQIFGLLGKVKVDALDNKEIYLMYFWNFKRPAVRTEQYLGYKFIINNNNINFKHFIIDGEMLADSHQ